MRLAGTGLLPACRYYLAAQSSAGSPPQSSNDSSLTRLLNAYATRSKDVYQFGVYTGNGLKKIGHSVRNFGHLWGFDSFQGIPEEPSEERPKPYSDKDEPFDDEALGANDVDGEGTELKEL